MLFESTFYKVRRRGVAKMFSNITFFPNIELAVVSVIVIQETLVFQETRSKVR